MMSWKLGPEVRCEPDGDWLEEFDRHVSLTGSTGVIP